MKANLKNREILNYLKEIHKNSTTPFVVFNFNKIIIFANNYFTKKFNFQNEKKVIGKELDFIFTKEDKQLVSFSSMHIEEIIKENHIFSYFPKDRDETFYYISTFKVGDMHNEGFYYAIFKEISELEEKLMEDSIRALVIASQLKDNDTGNHVKRVNAYSYVIAKHLYDTMHEIYTEIDKEFIEKIFKVASMHDVGKIGTPDYILTKTKKLNNEEFQIMKEHTINGAFILSKMAGQMARDIALFHHERWDGNGYPYQLKANQIPLSARIVALADVYDALRMQRHYKPTFSHEKAKQIIEDDKTKHFDPDIVDCFLEIESQFNDIFEKMRDDEFIKSYHMDSNLY